jgi:hypothetical protein
MPNVTTSFRLRQDCLQAPPITLEYGGQPLPAGPFDGLGLAQTKKLDLVPNN